MWWTQLVTGHQFVTNCHQFRARSGSWIGHFQFVKFCHRHQWQFTGYFISKYPPFKVSFRQGVFLFCYFWNFRQTNAVCWAEKYPETKKTDTLINQSQEIRPQGLDLGRSTSIRGCTSAQIKTLRPYFSIFSITVVRICLRKQQSKFFTNMLTTPSIEHVNIWFDSASPCIWPLLEMVVHILRR